MSVIQFIAQVAGGIMVLFVLAHSYDDYRRGKESWQIFVFWSVASLAIMAVTLFPQIITWTIEQLGGQRTGLGTIFGLGLVFLFYLSYRIFLKADRIEKRFTKLIQDIALRDLADDRKR